MLFSSPSYEDAKLKFYDHLFNTIGNGIDQDTFFKKFSTDSIIDGPIPTHLIDESTVYRSNNSTKLFPEQVVQNIINIERFGTVFKKRPFENFYPNFQKEYSLVYKIGIDHLRMDWLLEAKWFYDKALLMLSDDVEYYIDGVMMPSYVIPFIESTIWELDHTIKKKADKGIA